MMNRHLLVAALSLACAGAYAQTTTASTVQRDVNQETRIENGLKDGKLSDAERARLNAAQNKVSADIAADRHNAVTGNPNSASSRRMQADVARNVNQEKRIEAGIQNGSLTNHEVSKLQRGQAHVDAKEVRAGVDGHVGKAEQRSFQGAEDHQSNRIHHEKADAKVRG